MNIPPPPPSDRRFLQFLTPAASQAVRGQTGELFVNLVKALLHANSEQGWKATEVSAHLLKFIWPPLDPTDFFRDFPHLPFFPTHITVAGSCVEVLESDPLHLPRLVVVRSAIKSAIGRAYGELDDFLELCQSYAREGGDVAEIDRMLRALTRDIEAEHLYPSGDPPN